jgi:hypothetical protein
MEAATELLEEETIGVMETIESLVMQERLPGRDVTEQRAICVLTGLVTINGKCLELRMTSVDMKIIESQVAVFVVLDKEGQLRVGRKTRVFALEEGDQQTSQGVLYILLKPVREIRKPNTKGQISTKSMRRRDIDAVRHEVPTTLRIPGQERFGRRVGRKTGQDIFDGSDIEAANKSTQEESFILELKGRLDGVTQDLSIIGTGSKPRRNQTGIRVNDELAVLRVGHVPRPSRPMVGTKLTTITKDGRPARCEGETLTVV